MQWDTMTIDEFASYKREDGMKVVKIDGIWWAEVRPCFFRPLFPFCEIKPWSKRYPPKAFFGGFLHVVPDSVQTTSCINFHVYENLKNYSLDILSSKRRKVTKDSMARFSARPIAGPEEFVADAYEVYKVFYKRTKYWYKSDRVELENFRAWALKLYAHPKICKTGVYLDDRLAAVETSFQVEDVIFGDNLFSDNVSLKLNVVDFITHKLRESAAATDAKYFFSGLPTGVTTLDNSKTKRGCTLLKLPAYCKINPVALSLARLLMKDSYHKLLTVMAPDTSDSPSPGT